MQSSQKPPLVESFRDGGKLVIGDGKLLHLQPEFKALRARDGDQDESLSKRTLWTLTLRSELAKCIACEERKQL